jgi:hypothetical protein
LFLNKPVLLLIAFAIFLLAACSGSKPEPTDLGFQSKLVEPECFIGSWQFDGDASDSQERVINKLKRHIKREASHRYPRKVLEEKPQEQVRLPQGIPVIAFLSEDIEMQIKDENLQINSKSLQRTVHLNGNTGHQSLKNFDQQAKTVVASFENGVIYIDSKTLSNLTVLEQYRLLSNNRLHHHVELRDSYDKPVSVNRYYQRTSPINAGENAHCLGI